MAYNIFEYEITMWRKKSSLTSLFVVIAVKFQKVVFQNPTHLTKVEYSLIIHTNTRDLKKKNHFTAYMQWLSRAMWKMLLYYSRGG